jgi:hypothetical protein
MPEITLESLAARLAAVERQLAEQTAAPPPRTKDWRRTVGTMENNEFTRAMLAEIEAAREAERAAARAGRDEGPGA